MERIDGWKIKGNCEQRRIHSSSEWSEVKWTIIKSQISTVIHQLNDTHTSSGIKKEKRKLTSMLLIGVKESHPRSRSIFLLERLSTITTSCPWSLKKREVGHPQKPSPPKTITFFFPPLWVAPFVASAFKANESNRTCWTLGVVKAKAATVGNKVTMKLITLILMNYWLVQRSNSTNFIDVPKAKGLALTGKPWMDDDGQVAVSSGGIPPEDISSGRQCVQCVERCCTQWQDVIPTKSTAVA